MMRNGIHILVLFLLLSLSCDTKVEEEVVPLIGSASIQLESDKLFVGDKIKEVEIKAEGFEGVSQLQLLLSNKWGIKVLEAELNSDSALFDLDDIRFEERGEVEFILTAETQVLDRHKLEILPLRGDSLIESYLGPKTIFVGREEKSMLTNVTTDKFGNPILDESTIEYNLRYPGEKARQKEIKTDHLISFIQFYSKEETGKIIIGANSGKASIREQEVRVIPSYPEQISIEIVEWFPYADSRQTAWLRSGIIRDKYGNVVANGISIVFVVEGEDGTFNEYKSSIIGGIANVYIENPPVKTTWKVYAKIDDKNRSNVVTLNYQSNIESMVFDYDRRNHKISVGPIKSELGQFVNDGTEVSLTISKGEEEIKLENEALDGFCEFKLRGKKFVEGTYALALEVGGERSTQRLVIR